MRFAKVRPDMQHVVEIDDRMTFQLMALMKVPNEEMIAKSPGIMKRNLDS